MQVGPCHSADPYDGIRQKAQFKIVSADEDNAVQIGQPFLGQIEKLLRSSTGRMRPRTLTIPTTNGGQQGSGVRPLNVETS